MPKKTADPEIEKHIQDISEQILDAKRRMIILEKKHEADSAEYNVLQKIFALNMAKRKYLQRRKITNKQPTQEERIAFNKDVKEKTAALNTAIAEFAKPPPDTLKKYQVPAGKKHGTQSGKSHSEYTKTSEIISRAASTNSRINKFMKKDKRFKHTAPSPKNTEPPIGEEIALGALGCCGLVALLGLAIAGTTLPAPPVAAFGLGLAAVAGIVAAPIAIGYGLYKAGEAIHDHVKEKNAEKAANEQLPDINAKPLENIPTSEPKHPPLHKDKKHAKHDGDPLVLTKQKELLPGSHERHKKQHGVKQKSLLSHKDGHSSLAPPKPKAPSKRH